MRGIVVGVVGSHRRAKVASLLIVGFVAAAISVVLVASAGASGCPSPSGDAYSQSVLADGPVAYYRLDESGGPTMCDMSTSKNDGTYSASGITYGVPGALSGDPDSAVAADGTPGVIGISNAYSAIAGNSSFTLEGWFRSTGTIQDQVLVALASPEDAARGAIVGLTTWSNHNCGSGSGYPSTIGLDEYSASNCWNTATDAVNLYDGSWHYLAVTYDASTYEVTGYVDGRSLGAQPADATLDLAAENYIRVGTWVDTAVNQPLIGNADEIAAYPTALSTAQIAAHYATAVSAGGRPPGVTVSGSPLVVSSSSARFSGTVDSNGSATTADFEYGLDPKYSGGGPVIYNEHTPAVQVSAGVTSFKLTSPVSGLVPNALYHVRLVATNSAGTTDGSDQKFTTAASPLPPTPILGATQNAVPVSGFVLVKLPHTRYAVDDPASEANALAKGQGFIPLTQARQLPSGTQIDARHGTLNLTSASATSTHGGLQTVTVSGAIFGINQSRTGLTKGLTTLSLLEGDFQGAPSYASCPNADSDTPAAHAAHLSPKLLQTLRASDQHGSFRTKGRYSSATVRGTVWGVRDLCDGTLTIVHRGTVDVFDFGTRKTIAVHAGQSYLAKAF
jgi:hypothetical protein